MKIPRHQIAAELAQRTLGTLDVKAFATEVAAYLLDTGRTGELDSLLRDIMQYRAEHGIVEVIAASAHPLTAEVKADIEAKVKAMYPDAKQIIISEVQDDSVIGGVRLDLANEQLDLSVRAKLNHFKQLTLAGKEV